jgi:hypothetical protein
MALKGMICPGKDDRLIPIQAVVSLVIAKASVTLLPCQILNPFIYRMLGHSRNSQKEDVVLVRRIAWSVKLVGRRLRCFKCFDMAMAVCIMSKIHKCPVDLYAGFAFRDDGQMSAHAWVECMGEVVIGNLHDLHFFTRIPMKRLCTKSPMEWVCVADVTER